MLISRWADTDRVVANPAVCSFGISETIGAVLISAGVGAETAGVIAPALLGAAGGALTSGVTGGDPLTGAFTGALTGGAIGGLGGGIGEATGLGTTAGDAIAGAGAGALGNAVTGGNPLTGALTGGASGLAAGLTANTPGAASSTNGVAGTADAAGAGSVTPSSTAATLAATPTTGISGASGAAAPAPAGVTAALGSEPLDLTAGASAGGGGIGGGGSANFPTPSLSPIAPSADTSSLISGHSAGGADNVLSSISTTPNASASATDLSAGTGLNGSISVPAAGGGAGTGAAAGPGLAASALTDLGVGPNTAGLIGKALGPAVAAGGLGYSLLSAPSGVSSSQAAGDTAALQKQAETLTSAGTANQNYLNTGTLPPGAQAAVNQATQAAKAKVRSTYASMGLAGSTMEAQALSNIDSQAASQVFTIGNQLVQTGLTQTQLADSIYQNLVNLNANQSQQTSQSIANLAAALSGGSGTTIRLAA